MTIKPSADCFDDCETNMITLESRIINGKTDFVLLNGYWIWWCYKHNQPLAWCEKDKVKHPVEG